ncbi:MAG: hypothetical protein RL846_35860 [Deltaproteobacteria bacterium]
MRRCSLLLLLPFLACAGEEPTTIDAPRDGGALDAGFVDAGARDAGFEDAGVSRDGGRDGGPTTSFVTDVAPILDNYCVRCHSSLQRPPRMDFRRPAMETYDRLVDRSAKRAVADYIEPGDPERSYLLLKIENRHLTIPRADGDFMPPNRENVRVSAGEVETIRLWIQEGAVP